MRSSGGWTAAIGVVRLPKGTVTWEETHPSLLRVKGVTTAGIGQVADVEPPTVTVIQCLSGGVDSVSPGGGEGETVTK